MGREEKAKSRIQNAQDPHRAEKCWETRQETFFCLFFFVRASPLNLAALLPWISGWPGQCPLPLTRPATSECGDADTLWFKVCRLEICLFGWGPRGFTPPIHRPVSAAAGSASAPVTQQAFPASPSLNTAHLAKGGVFPQLLSDLAATARVASLAAWGAVHGAQQRAGCSFRAANRTPPSESFTTHPALLQNTT